MENTLLKHFENIKTEVFTSDDNREFNTLNSNFLIMLAYNQAMLTSLQNLVQNYPIPNLMNETYHKQQAFNLSSYLKHVDDAIKHCYTQLYNGMHHFINAKYNLSFSNEMDKDTFLLLLKSDASNALPILLSFFEDKIKHTPVFEFAKKEFLQLINKQFFINSYSGTPTASWGKEKVTIDHFNPYSSYNGYKLYPWPEEITKRFLRMLSLFETGSLEISPKVLNSFPLGQEVDFSKNYTFENTTTIKHIRFFKNHRIDIVFNSMQSAKSFFELYASIAL